MSPEGKDRSSIPVNFPDSDGEDGMDTGPEESASKFSDDDQELTNAMAPEDDTTAIDDDAFESDDELDPLLPPAKGSTGDLALNMGGPEVAELVATRAEITRLEGEVKELRDSLARRQADFENYRKRMERERSETYN